MRPPLFIPKTWKTLDEFCAWYTRNGYPIRVPQNARVLPIEGSYTVCLFRQDVYQVEIYLANADIKSPRHSHPFEQKIIFLGGHFHGVRGVRNEDGTFGPEIARGSFGSPLSEDSSPELAHPAAGYMGLEVIKDHQWHELSGHGNGQGFVFLNCQKWPNKEMMSSAVIEYDGESLGEIHDKVISMRKQ